MSECAVDALEVHVPNSPAAVGVPAHRFDRTTPHVMSRSPSAVSSSRPAGIGWLDGEDGSERRRVRSIRRMMAEQEAAQRGRIVTEALAAWKDLRVAAWQERTALCLPSAPPASVTMRPRCAAPRPSEPASAIASATRSAPLLEDFYDREVRRAAARGGRELRRRQGVEAAQRERAIDEAAELRGRLAEELAQRRRHADDARRMAQRACAAEADLAALRIAFDAHVASGREALGGLRLRERHVEQLTEETVQLRERGDAIARSMRVEQEAAKRKYDALEAKHIAAKTETAKSAQDARREMEELQRALCEERQRAKELEEQVTEHTTVTTAMRAEIDALQDETAALRAELREAHAARRIAESAKRDAVNAKDNAADAHEAEMIALQKSLEKKEAEVKHTQQVLAAATEEKSKTEVHRLVFSADHLVTSPDRIATSSEASKVSVGRRLPLMSPSTSIMRAQPAVPSSSAMLSATVVPSPLVQPSVLNSHIGLSVESGSAVPTNSFAPSVVPMPSVINAEVRRLPAVAEAIRALIYARDYAVRLWADQSPTRTIATKVPACRETERRIIAECIATLTAAVAEARATLPHVNGSHSYSHIHSNHSSSDGLSEELQQHQTVLARVQNELQKAEGLRRAGLDVRTQPASAVLVQDAAIAVLIGALAKQLSALREALTQTQSETPQYYSSNGELRSAINGSSSATVCPPYVSGHSNCNGHHTLTKDLNFIAHTTSSPSPPLRHTFGFVGGRLEVSRDGTRLQRLVLPGVMDIMTCSALGAVDHRSALAAAASPNAMFAFTVRVGMRCDNVLVGLADRYMPLEGFGHAQNSCKYDGCYYLHLGRCSLYCPAQGIFDVPYTPFRHAASAREVAVQAGEKITCVLDPIAQTIRFLREGVDCGVAFAQVNLTRALFPALELNSRGCAIEFV